MAKTIILLHGMLTDLHNITGFSKDKIRRAVAGDDTKEDYRKIRTEAQELLRRRTN